MAGLSKSRILLNLQCPKRLWLQVNRPELAEVDSSMANRLSGGNIVGDIARSLYPDGLLIEPGTLTLALQETRQALNAPPRPLFEATFQSEEVLIRADLLLPDGNAYRMAEVKSSTSLKAYHLSDAAIQTWVCQQNELPMTRVEIAHINNSFVYPGSLNYQGLFKHVDVTEDIKELISQVPAWISDARQTLDGPCPVVEIGAQCNDPFPCPFAAHCHPAIPEGAFPLTILPYGNKVMQELMAKGIRDLREVSENQLSNPKHVRIWRSSLSGQAVLDETAGKKLRALDYPRYYLDFETIQFAAPIWAGTRPYAQIPFQWSCHIETSTGNLLHQEYLSDGRADPRRSFAETLIAALGIAGPVIVYNAGFECGRMRELANDFPDLAAPLDSIIERVFDLLPVAREHYYHPAMMGSWSIKSVLPTIAPELDYSRLEVADGGMAQEAFLELLNPETSAERTSKITDGLLKYCERDTLAMVRVAHFFEGKT